MKFDQSLSLSFLSPRHNAKRVSQRPDISGPINFTHVQHFGPYQSLNPEDMPVSILYNFSRCYIAMIVYKL